MNTKKRNKNIIEEVSAKLIGYYSDPEKKKRLNEDVLCKFCYYYGTGRIGGQVFTTVPCAECEEDMTFPSTCTDVLCKECAKEIGNCKRCGQKLD